jgi:hypothetical protein
MPPEHRKVINAILLCRTEENGSVVYRCEECGLNHILNRSCGNRHCPQCQSHKTTMWLERRMERMLPGHHFMMTFTVPEELRDFIRSNQRICYAALFAASSAAMKKLCLDPRHVGGDLPGFFGVLHTWGRQLQYHPHIHYVVPGGAISTADRSWLSAQWRALLPAGQGPLHHLPRQVPRADGEGGASRCSPQGGVAQSLERELPGSW